MNLKLKGEIVKVPIIINPHVKIFLIIISILLVVYLFYKLVKKIDNRWKEKNKKRIKELEGIVTRVIEKRQKEREKAGLPAKIFPIRKK